MILAIIIIILLLVIIYNALEPKLDIIHNNSTYVKNHQVYLWYNNIYNKNGARRYVKLFEFN